MHLSHSIKMQNMTRIDCRLEFIVHICTLLQKKVNQAYGIAGVLQPNLVHECNGEGMKHETRYGRANLVKLENFLSSQSRYATISMLLSPQQRTSAGVVSGYQPSATPAG